MITNLFIVWVPYLWVEVVAVFITCLPPFVVFIQMIQHHDKVEYREKLYKTYMIFGTLGLVLYAAA